MQDLKGDEKALNDFYLPFAALCLSDTVNFLIRSAIRKLGEEQIAIQKPRLKLARDMIASLKDPRRIWNWDLGNICLARYAHVVRAGLASDGGDIPELEEVLVSDFPEVDRIAPELWDMYNGA